MKQDSGILPKAEAKASSEPIAIIGMSCFFPGAGSLSAYWTAIRDLRDAIGDIPADHWEPADYYDPDPGARDKTYSRRGAFLDKIPFEPLKYGIVPNDLPAIDSTQLWGLVAADRALADAGYPAGEDFDHARTAVMLGVTGALKMVVSLGSRLAHPQLARALKDSGVDDALAAEVLKRFGAEFTEWRENSFPGLLGNVTAGRIANRLNLGGANLVVDAACASSLAAIRQGVMELRAGQADLVVSGGVDTFSDPFMYTCFSKTPALSPTGEVRAYDQDGDGTMLGEGVGLLVLKRASDAQRDGDRVFALIRGIGSASDGKGAAIFAPSVDGQARALENAYREAGLSPASVGLVEGHGTGTAVGDAVEAEALTRVFQNSSSAKNPWCALGSVKSQIGHTKAAAGVAGLIKAALALHYKVLPPTAKVKKPLKPLAAKKSPFHLSAQARPWLSREPRRAAVSAFGFGGSNFHAVLEEASPRKTEAEGRPDIEIFAASGPSRSALASSLEQLLKGEGRLADLALSSRRNFSAQEPCRLVIAARADEMADLARRALNMTASPDFSEDNIPEGIYFGSAPPESASLGFLAPGAESAARGMFQELATDWPEMIEALSEAEASLAAEAPELAPLGLLLYPPDLAAREHKAAWTQDFKDMRPRAAAALAAHRGLARVLARFGLSPAKTLGPSDMAELAKAENKSIALWLEVGPGRALSRIAAKSGLKTLALDQGAAGGGRLDLARFLARLASWGLAIDFTAWPQTQTETRAATGFTVSLSGANQFVKKEIPPSPPRAPLAAQPAAPAENPSLAAIEAIEALGRQTALQHQEFLRAQTETLTLLKEHLRADASTAPLATGHKNIPATHAVVRTHETPQDIMRIKNIPAAHAVVRTHETPQDIMRIKNIPATHAVVRTHETPQDIMLIKNIPAAHAVVRTHEASQDIMLIVAEETGYPVEMLNLDMNLESDLGLDSIKKVEIMAVLSERCPEMQAFGAENMAGVTTLRDLAQLAGGIKAPAPAAQPQASKESLWRDLLELVSAETGYPPEMLSREMRLSEDLGLDSIKMVEIAALVEERLETAPLSAAALSSMASLGDLCAALDGNAAALPASADLKAPPLDGEDLILTLVAEETGYPKEMLNLSMKLESDLGLDSIRRVEIMAALSERLPGADLPDMTQVMGGLETLGDLLKFLPGQAPPAAPALSAAPAAYSSPEKILFEVVARETGYPAEMLNLSMNLESDLGLDSIRRVEIMAALSEAAGGEGRDLAALLAEARTLGDLLKLMDDSSAEPGAPEAAPEESPRRGPGRPPKNSPPSFNVTEAASPAKAVANSLSLYRLEMKNQYPAAREKRFGLPSGASLHLLADPSPLADELAARLSDEGLKVARANWREAASLRKAAPPAGLILVWPRTGGPDLPLTAFQAIRDAGPSLIKSAERGMKSLLLGASFMGGSFALNEPDAENFSPDSAALSGLIKTAAREWPAVRAHAVDLPGAALNGEAASFVESIRGAVAVNSVEVGLAAPSRLAAPVLKPYELSKLRESHIKEGQNILVTGGARGVTLAAMLEVARFARPHFIILGRTPLSGREPRWMEGITDEPALRRAIYDNAAQKPDPMELARQSRLVMRSREVRQGLAALENAGARVTYVSGDLKSPRAVSGAVSEIRRAHGPISGFIHGAGLLADSLIEDKTDEDFESVFNTKLRLAENILAALSGDPVSLVAFFSSSSARFGRRGQADYAAGNESLNKLAQLAARRHNCKSLSVNWGPWDGGMVDSGLARVFAREGVGLIPVDEGARLFAALIEAPKSEPVEIVALTAGTDLSSL